MCDLDDTGTPSIFKIIRSTAALGRILPIFGLGGPRTPRGGSGKGQSPLFDCAFYYESRKREIKTILIYEDRLDERLKN